MAVNHVRMTGTITGGMRSTPRSEAGFVATALAGRRPSVGWVEPLNGLRTLGHP
jgi:hypothetical protein